MGQVYRGIDAFFPEGTFHIGKVFSILFFQKRYIFLILFEGFFTIRNFHRRDIDNLQENKLYADLLSLLEATDQTYDIDIQKLIEDVVPKDDYLWEHLVAVAEKHGKYKKDDWYKLIKQVAEHNPEVAAEIIQDNAENRNMAVAETLTATKFPVEALIKQLVKEKDFTGAVDWLDAFQIKAPKSPPMEEVLYSDAKTQTKKAIITKKPKYGFLRFL